MSMTIFPRVDQRVEKVFENPFQLWTFYLYFWQCLGISRDEPLTGKMDADQTDEKMTESLPKSRTARGKVTNTKEWEKQWEGILTVATSTNVRHQRRLAVSVFTYKVNYTESMWTQGHSGCKLHDARI